MKASCFLIRLATLVVVLVPAVLSAQQKAPVADDGGGSPDDSKRRVESQLGTELGKSMALAAPLQMPDASKIAIEAPVEGLWLHMQEPAFDVKTNPLVEPGKVNWHADFATACAASAESGKPVFLFQLLGQLDHRFT